MEQIVTDVGYGGYAKTKILAQVRDIRRAEPSRSKER